MAASCADDQVADLAHCTEPAATSRDVVATLLHACHRIRNCDRKANRLQEREIGKVVAHKAAIDEFDAERPGQLAHRGDLVSAALDDVADAEFLHAAFDGC